MAEPDKSPVELPAVAGEVIPARPWSSAIIGVTNRIAAKMRGIDFMLPRPEELFPIGFEAQSHSARSKPSRSREKALQQLQQAIRLNCPKRMILDFVPHPSFLSYLQGPRLLTSMEPRPSTLPAPGADIGPLTGSRLQHVKYRELPPFYSNSDLSPDKHTSSCSIRNEV